MSAAFRWSPGRKRAAAVPPRASESVGDTPALIVTALGYWLMSMPASAPAGLAPRAGRGDGARGRLLLVQVQHGRSSVHVILRHSVERVAGMNEGDLRSRRVLEDHAIALDGDGARTRGPISPLQRISRIPSNLKHEAAATRRCVVTGDVPVVALPRPAERGGR